MAVRAQFENSNECVLSFFCSFFAPPCRQSSGSEGGRASTLATHTAHFLLSLTPSAFTCLQTASAQHISPKTTPHKKNSALLTLSFFYPHRVGVFSTLTNSYALVAVGASENFYSVFEAELQDVIPICHATIAGTRIVGRLTAGNKKGLLVPTSTTDQELQHLRNSIPDEVRIQRIEERLSALGNVICCNDHVALVHPDIERETEEM